MIGACVGKIQLMGLMAGRITEHICIALHNLSGFPVHNILTLNQAAHWKIFPWVELVIVIVQMKPINHWITHYVYTENRSINNKYNDNVMFTD